MSEPTTPNKALTIPNTGDLPGAWGTAALNTNFAALDGMLGGVTILSLSSATTFALSAPSGTITATTGPNQSQNALIRLTGTLSGNAVIKFSLPGFYIVENLCTVGSNYVQLSPSSGTGNAIGAPPGRKCHVFFDGTSMDYANPKDPATALDLHNYTAMPAWMTACTVSPYLIKDGSTYSTATYPALGAILGSTFGGNGINTFAVPDELSRMRLPYDTTGTGRVTTAVSGINGQLMGSAGGSQAMQQHNHTYTDNGHSHGIANGLVTAEAQGAAGSSWNIGPIGSGNTESAAINIAINSTGSGGSQNMPPALVSFLALIKT